MYLIVLDIFPFGFFCEAMHCECFWLHFCKKKTTLIVLIFFLQHIAVSSGSGLSDFEKLISIIEAIPLIKYICLDVANGYSEHFVEFVKAVHVRFPKHTIMVGVGEVERWIGL